MSQKTPYLFGGCIAEPDVCALANIIGCPLDEFFDVAKSGDSFGYGDVYDGHNPELETFLEDRHMPYRHLYDFPDSGPTLAVFDGTRNHLYAVDNDGTIVFPLYRVQNLLGEGKLDDFLREAQSIQNFEPPPLMIHTCGREEAENRIAFDAWRREHGLKPLLRTVRRRTTRT